MRNASTKADAAPKRTRRRASRPIAPPVELPTGRVSFSTKTAFEAYSDWVKYGTHQYMMRAALYALPYVKIIAARMQVPSGRKPEIVSDGQWAVFEVVSRRRFDIPYGWRYPAAAYASLLRKKIWTAMRKRADQMTYNEFLYGNPTLPYGQYTKYPRFKETELKLFLEKLPVALVEAVAKKTRFTGDDREAVLWIAQRLVSDRLISVKLMKKRFGVKDPDFLISYATVLLRCAVYDMRAEHDGVVIGDWDDLTMGIDPESCVELSEVTTVDEEADW